MKNTFYYTLTGTNEALKGERAEQLTLEITRAKRHAIEVEENAVLKKTAKLRKLKDFAPKNSQDLGYREDIDAEAYASESTKLEMEVFVGQMKVDYLWKVFNAEFGPVANDPVTPTPKK